MLVNTIIVPLVVSSIIVALKTGIDRKFWLSFFSIFINVSFGITLIWVTTLLFSFPLNPLFVSSVLLGTIGGITYIVLSIVSVICDSYHDDPTLSEQILFLKGMFLGRRSIEIVLMILSFMFLGHILPILYTIDQVHNLLQQERIISELSMLFFMILIFVLSAPLTAFLTLRLVYRRRV